MSNSKKNIKERNEVSEEIIEKESVNQKESYKQMPENEQNNSKKSRKKGLLILLVIFLLLLLSTLSTAFALANRNNEKIYNNISIDGIEVSALTKEQAVEKLESETRQQTTKTN